MILHLNKELFKDAVIITANKLNIPPEFVEKDYWVTFSLHQIFNNEIGKDAIFPTWKLSVGFMSFRNPHVTQLPRNAVSFSAELFSGKAELPATSKMYPFGVILTPKLEELMKVQVTPFLK